MAFEPFNWTCPHCDRAQTVTDKQFSDDWKRIWNYQSKLGNVVGNIETISCANPECRELTLSFAILKKNPDYTDFGINEPIHSWKLLPESAAKPQPDYIPEALRDDYNEACRIVSLSPKASATLARRCLQGMIRDFADIAEKTLFQEIKRLRKEVDEGDAPKGVTFESVEAIDHVRGIGNIGAHMEEDVNLIIEIEPGEAEQLIGLIELLFKEWYVARHERQRRLDAIKATYEAKVEAKKPQANAAAQRTEEKTVAPRAEEEESAARGDRA